MQAELILSNGMRFKGTAFGHMKDVRGEVIFTTRTFGYQEFLTDPAIAGKIVVFTYPLIGNYGFNLEDLESSCVHAKGVIVRQKCDYPSNFRCEMDMAGFLKQNKTLGMEGIDTRELTKIIVKEGTMKGILTLRSDALLKKQIDRNLETISDFDLINEVTTKEIKIIEGTGIKVALIDLGVTNTEIELLKENNCHITVFPATASVEEIEKISPNAIYISGGPGDPRFAMSVVSTVKSFTGKYPILGTRLGALVVAMAQGADVRKIKFGHHSSNTPVKAISKNRIYMTSQNSDYTVESLPDTLKVTHINISDGTIEGFADENRKIYGVSFLPQRKSAQIEDTVKDFLQVVLLVAGGNANA